MILRALFVLLLLLAAGCSRGGAPQPLPSSPAAGTEPAVLPTAPTEQPSSSEAPTEPTELTGPITDLAVIPGVSNDGDWVALAEPRVLDGFTRWQRARGIEGEAAELADAMHEQYGFEREVQIAYVHRRGARSDAPRTRQLLVSRFARTDDGLSEAWCSVDEEGREAVELPESRAVQRAVDRLVALPGSCGAVREAAEASGSFQADISFRFGRHMVQVAAVERDPVAALKALSVVAPLVYDRLVDRAD